MCEFNKNSQTLIKEQINQIKMLTQENQIHSQRTKIFKNKILELEEIINKNSSQMESLQNQILFSEKENNFKLETAKDHINKLEEANVRLADFVAKLQEKYFISQNTVRNLEGEMEKFKEEIKNIGEDLNISQQSNFRKDDEIVALKKKIHDIKFINKKIKVIKKKKKENNNIFFFFLK